MDGKAMHTNQKKTTNLLYLRKEWYIYHFMLTVPEEIFCFFMLEWNKEEITMRVKMIPAIPPTTRKLILSLNPVKSSEIQWNPLQSSLDSIHDLRSWMVSVVWSMSLLDQVFYLQKLLQIPYKKLKYLQWICYLNYA